MKNSIAIGEAGVSSDHGSVGQAYRFATKGNSESPKDLVCRTVMKRMSVEEAV